MLPIDRKRAETILRSLLFCTIIEYKLFFSNISFFVFWIKFRKTKQIVGTFVATTLKALLPVAKTSGRLSWHKFYTCNIHYLFWIFLLIYPPISIQKRCATEATHRKTQTPIVATQNQINGIMVSDILPVGISVFAKFKSSMPKKGYNIPFINRKTISPDSLFGFV